MIESKQIFKRGSASGVNVSVSAAPEDMPTFSKAHQHNSPPMVVLNVPTEADFDPIHSALPVQIQSDDEEDEDCIESA